MIKLIHDTGKTYAVWILWRKTVIWNTVNDLLLLLLN